jgi:hypothetical protein
VQRFNRTIREESNESTMQGIGEELLKIAGVDGFSGVHQKPRERKGMQNGTQKEQGDANRR